MLKIRLSRTGHKNYPSYRVVVADSHKKRDGRVTEIIGNYNPQIKPPALNLKKDRFDYWLSKGAQVTEGVKRLIS